MGIGESFPVRATGFVHNSNTKQLKRYEVKYQPASKVFYCSIHMPAPESRRLLARERMFHSLRGEGALVDEVTRQRTIPFHIS